MRVGLVGLGDIGLGAHLPALLRHPGLELTTLADPAPDRRAAAMDTLGAARRLGKQEIASTAWSAGAVQLLTSLDDVLAAGVDAVVLATPPWITPALAVQAARAGRWVLAEKPIATSVQAAGIYDTLTPAERDRIQVGLTYRHDPAILTLADWIATGRLGSPLLVRAHIYDEQRRAGDLEHTKRILATLERGMPVVHEGAHVFDWLSFLLQGQPEPPTDAWAIRTDPGLPAPNLVGATLRYPAGHTALVEFGWLTDALPRCELSVLGDRGLAVLDGTDFSLTLNGERTTFPGDRISRCFARQLDRFVALSRGGSPEPSLADGLAALRTAEQLAGAAR